MLELKVPFIRELLAQTRQESIILVLQARFGEVPPEITTRLGRIFSLKRLRELIDHAAIDPDLEEFRARVLYRPYRRAPCRKRTGHPNPPQAG